MGYWSNQPMAGDYPEDIQTEIRNTLLESLNKNLLEEIYSDIQEFEVGKVYSSDDIYVDKYEKDRMNFINWLLDQCNTNENTILKEIKNIVEVAKTEEKFSRADLNDVCFIIPLSFLEWGIKLEPKSELSQYLLTLLKGTDGGSGKREYPLEENAYPNGINTPSDFIKTYIDKWDDLISGKINLRDIKSTSNIKSMKFGHLLNTR